MAQSSPLISLTPPTPLAPLAPPGPLTPLTLTSLTSPGPGIASRLDHIL